MGTPPHVPFGPWFSPAKAFQPGGSLADELERLRPQLQAARISVLENAAATEIALAERAIDDYRRRRGDSLLGRALKTGNRLAAQVDRLVVVAAAGEHLAMQALVDSCAHPRHNELSRAQRGSQPRIYLTPPLFDNDDLAGLVDLLSERPTPGTRESWAVVAIEPGPDCPHAERETLQATLAILVDELGRSSSGDRQRVADRVVAIAPPESSLAALGERLGCEIIPPPAMAAEGAPTGGPRAALDAGAAAYFGPAVLLPAATLGFNARTLLDGAAAANHSFRTETPETNQVLEYAGACYLARRHGWALKTRAWAAALNGLAGWHERICQTALDDCPAASSAEVLVTDLIAAPRRKQIQLPCSAEEHLQESDPVVRFIEDEVRETAQAAAHPQAQSLALRRLHEPAIGQLVQFWLLAARVQVMLSSLAPDPFLPGPTSRAPLA